MFSCVCVYRSNHETGSYLPIMVIVLFISHVRDSASTLQLTGCSSSQPVNCFPLIVWLQYTAWDTGYCNHTSLRFYTLISSFFFFSFSIFTPEFISVKWVSRWHLENMLLDLTERAEYVSSRWLKDDECSRQDLTFFQKAQNWSPQCMVPAVAGWNATAPPWTHSWPLYNCCVLGWPNKSYKTQKQN